MSERPTTIGPRVNMGGTCKQDLLDAYCVAMDALDAAAWAVATTTPILRNYRPDTDLWRMAMNLHQARLAQLKRMKAGIEAIAGYIVAQLSITHKSRPGQSHLSDRRGSKRLCISNRADEFGFQKESSTKST